jgi:hypothetical protein
MEIAEPSAADARPSLRAELALSVARKYDEQRGSTAKRIETVIFEAIYALHHRLSHWKFSKVSVIGWIIELFRTPPYSLHFA